MSQSGSQDMPGTAVLDRQTYMIAKLRLRVLAGVDKGTSVESVDQEVTIGTARGNLLRLQDPSVSRHQCVLRVTGDGVHIRDLGSTNGTVVDGLRVESAFLPPRARLTLGSSTIEVEVTNDKLSEAVSSQVSFGSVIGISVEMRRLFTRLAKVAPTNATVLLEGETGVGKGLIAEAIHERSARAKGPFVVVDCSAIPPTLIESELFGHKKGAFTGATSDSAGLFQSADGGTVFLDELGELPSALQPKLLRVLENREVRPVGQQTARPVDVRVVAATNRDLRLLVNRGEFRSDLWYRLNTVRLLIPAVRDRVEDIPLLVSHFARQIAPDGHVIDPAMIEAMQRAQWPGNVRELRSAVERALIFDSPDAWHDAQNPLDEPAADEPFDSTMSFRAAKMKAMARWERGYLLALIGESDGNISKAARAARMDRSHLRELLRRYELTAPKK